MPDVSLWLTAFFMLLFSFNLFIYSTCSGLHPRHPSPWVQLKPSGWSSARASGSAGLGIAVCPGTSCSALWASGPSYVRIRLHAFYGFCEDYMQYCRISATCLVESKSPVNSNHVYYSQFNTILIQVQGVLFNIYIIHALIWNGCTWPLVHYKTNMGEMVGRS